MDNERDPVLTFLAGVGIDGEIVIGNYNERIIVMPTEQFNLHRNWVEAWFVLVEYHPDFCHFHERLRGTGDTAE